MNGVDSNVCVFFSSSSLHQLINFPFIYLLTYNIATLNGLKCFFFSSFVFEKRIDCVKVSATRHYVVDMVNMVSGTLYQNAVIFFENWMIFSWCLNLVLRALFNWKLCGLLYIKKTSNCCSKFNIHFSPQTSLSPALYVICCRGHTATVWKKIWRMLYNKNIDENKTDVSTLSHFKRDYFWCLFPEGEGKKTAYSLR